MQVNALQNPFVLLNYIEHAKVNKHNHLAIPVHDSFSLGHIISWMFFKEFPINIVPYNFNLAEAEYNG